jgi:hypothetical protein
MPSRAGVNIGVYRPAQKQPARLCSLCQNWQWGSCGLGHAPRFYMETGFKRRCEDYVAIRAQEP